MKKTSRMKHKNGHMLLLAALGGVLLLLLTACSKQQTPGASLPAADVPPATQVQPEAEAPQAAEPELSEPAVPAEPAEPEAPARTVSYAMLLGGAETTVYPEVSDAEIIFWDSAVGGQIAAVAKFAQAMPGAADALQSCDFTDLDGDGNSDLTADFTFADGSTASLLWFYADGGFVYNAEFSILLGETPAGDGE